jgi:uncharacterized repeat protein (TIGR01451 family)
MSLTDPFASPLTVTTDYTDYAPGTTAVFTASNVAIGGMVTFDVDHIIDVGADGVAGTADDTLANDISGTDPWTITDGGEGDLDGVANGQIVTSWYVNQDALNQTFQLAVSEIASGDDGIFGTADDTTVATATANFTDSVNAGDVKIDQWSNGDAPDANGGDEAWQNGNLNTNNAHFTEGDGVPYRAVLDDLDPGVVYTLTIQWDTVSGGKYAFDYLTSFNFSFPGGADLEPVPTPLDGVTDLSGVSTTPTLLAVPGDTQLLTGFNAGITDGLGSTQPSGVQNFSIYGSVSTLSTLGYVYTPDLTQASITIQFTYTGSSSNGDDSVVIAWGGHIAEAAQWRDDAGETVVTAAGINGSSYHMRLLGLTEGGAPVSLGNQDRSLSADAIAAPANPAITLDKQVSVDGGTVWFDEGVGVLETPSLLGSAAADLQYRFIVTNTGDVTLTNVTLTDIPLDAIAGLPGNIGTLTAGQSVTITVDGTWFAGENLDTATVTTTEGVDATDQADYYGAEPGVTLDKGIVSEDGLITFQFAGDITVPTILVGHTVFFEALVDNTDPVIDVTSAEVTDVNPDATFDGPILVLAGSQDNVYDGVSTLAVAGLHTDTATFAGTATDDGGNTSEWTAEDSATYFGADPSIAIVKEVSVDGGANWEDADTATGPFLLESGPAPMFRFTVTNTGNVELTNLTLDDDVHDLNGVADGNDLTIASLAANGGEFQTEITVGWAAGQQTDTATVSGSFADDVGNTAELSDSDSTNYFGAAPSLATVKQADAGQVADAADEVITYTITVENTGNQTLTGVEVTDPYADAGSIVRGADISGDGDDDLEVGETWSYTAAHTVTQAEIDSNGDGDGALENTATADSTQSDPDSDDASVPVDQNPSLAIVKQTSGYDTNNVLHTGDGIFVKAGTTVTWIYTVTNAGNVSLSDVVVTDDAGTAGVVSDDLSTLTGEITYASGDDGDGVLQVGEEWVFTASGTAGEAPYSNIAVVEATPPSGDEVSDTDDSSYVGTFTTDYLGLTAGFWSQHLQAWDGNLATNKNNANLVPGVLSSKDVLYALPTHGYGEFDLTHAGTELGVLLGDADANGTDNGGEVTLGLSLLIAQKLVSANLSTKSDARLNLLQQAVAAELNVYNHADDPGKLSANGGNDLLGTAVKWLTGQLTLANGNPIPTNWNIDDNGNGILDSGTEISFTAKGISFSGTAVATSSADWKSDFLIDDNASGPDVYATGEQLKNALEAFNQGKLVTSADGLWVGWNVGGIISDAQTNDQDGLWKVLIDHGIGHYA